jgi:pimeloyl-ACP methyl ester carboxylesterase
MPLLTKRAIRYMRAWTTRPHVAIEEEILLDRDGTSVPATLVRPRNQPGPFPAWVVMHGITRPGREHQQLVRFTRAVAAGGVLTIVPEVPEWRELSLVPHLSAPTIRAAIAGLRDTGLVIDGPVGVIGFSFGAPHAIASSGCADLKDEIAGTAGFGGYCSLESTFRFMMTGVHHSLSREHVLQPDPYGRWIAGANYLTAISAHQDAGDVAGSLRELAAYAGDRGDPSWDPAYDPVIQRLRGDVDESRRDLFDLFAPPSTATPDVSNAAEIAEELAAAARRVDPEIDPADALANVEAPVHILHGRSDHLIPFSEAYHLRDAIPPNPMSRLTVTRLFGHSGQDRFPFRQAIAEVPRFSKALSEMLALV